MPHFDRYLQSWFVVFALVGLFACAQAEVPSEIRKEIVRSWKLSLDELRAEFDPMKLFLESQARATKANGSYGGNIWREQYGNEIDILVIQSTVAKSKYPDLKEFDLDYAVWTSVKGKTRLNHNDEMVAQKVLGYVDQLLRTAQLARQTFGKY